jgi:hypothetical protein
MGSCVADSGRDRRKNGRNMVESGGIIAHSCAGHKHHGALGRGCRHQASTCGIDMATSLARLSWWRFIGTERTSRIMTVVLRHTTAIGQVFSCKAVGMRFTVARDSPPNIPHATHN